MSDSQPSTASQANNLDNFELELLKQEYFFLQNTIEDYNKQIWAIKALGITGTGAVILFALQQNKSLIALLGCAIPIFFWVLESQWKHFQRGFYPRVSEIETILLETCKFRGPAIFNSWSYSLKRVTVPKRKGYIWDGLLNPTVFISYILEIVFLLIAWKVIPLI
ncbi:hypothetical protein [Nostoc sp. 106C]|uniref:hypothetical protein n=1 Tax=Nostoc sp. 106C TaxID=1932667 RepID=UPI000A384362|nr:hypothetical protein [Nostoc sp. 106C]OUL28252.1 hypothetical protein BV375_18780 [Nostoc sp. 106C]